MSSLHTQNPDQASIMYIEHYLDVVENLPNHLARIMSRIHEIDIQRTKIANNLDSTLKEYLQNTIEGEKNKKLNNFLTMLVQLQNLSDNKIGLAQNMVDQIDIRTRQLESQSRGANNSLNISQPHSSSSSSNANLVNSYSNLNGNINGRGNTTNSTTNQNSNDPPIPESSNNERNNSSTADVPALVSTSASTSALASDPASTSAAASTSASTSTTITTTKDNGKEPNSTNHSNGNGKRSSRRSHGNKKDLNPDSNGGGSGDERSSTPITTERSSTGKRTNKRGLKGAHKNEGKRRKNSYNYNNDSPTAVYGGVDPDEPTYCLCEQVSYGEMICCDNPTCKIEWFHFMCVSLTAIPKGRWFCPNCRGERSNILRK